MLLTLKTLRQHKLKEIKVFSLSNSTFYLFKMNKKEKVKVNESNSSCKSINLVRIKKEKDPRKKRSLINEA